MVYNRGSIFSKQFSMRFLEFLLKEYEEPENKKMMMDDFHIKAYSRFKVPISEIFG